VSRHRHHPPRLEARRPAPRSGRQRHANRVSDPGHVIVGDPSAQIDDFRRQKRLGIDNLDDVLEIRPSVVDAVVSNDASCDGARAYGHTNARANRRQVDAIGDAVREGIEVGNGNGDRN
jgi:hypothetical protein